MKETKDGKKFVKRILIGIAILVVLLITVVLIYIGGIKLRINTHPGNAGTYSAQLSKRNEHSLLNGKKIIFLGSSVVYGAHSKEESFVEYLEKEDGILSIKEALSSTTLVDQEVFGRASYITRLKTIDTTAEVDAFVCQLSTNDATLKKPLGEMTDSFDKEDFDTQTVTGAIEYIIAYAKETWNCPVIFFTGTQYDSEQYELMVDRLLEIADKWDIDVIDLWHDIDVKDISESDYNLYMSDGIHPTRAGYRDWWTPKFRENLIKYLDLENKNL